MNISHSLKYIAKPAFGLLLTLLLLMNLGPAPAMAERAGLSAPESPPQAACTPSIKFTHKPPVGSNEQVLYGRVDCADPAQYKVAVYIYVTGWYNKPTWASPLTTINANGAWQTDVDLGNATDRLAVKYAAFLLKNGVPPTHLGGEHDLPPAMFTQSDAHVVESRRTIEFSGYTWNVKATALTQKVGPGPNHYSYDPNDVWVDGNGNLHLTITEKNGEWYATEVYPTVDHGYGTYTFTLASRVDLLDRNAVMGLFTWDYSMYNANYGEIDIEFSRWGQASGDNAQYVVQPFDTPGNRHRFLLNLTGLYSIHSFDWQPGQITFESYQGYLPKRGALIESWTYTGADVPAEGAGNARINLWLNNGTPPSNGQRVEVVVESFQFPTSFSDVPDSHWAWTSIQRLYESGVTSGCGEHPFRFCSESTVTRAQMAVFLEKGMHFPNAFSPPNAAPTFTDTAGHWAEDWIETLRADGITGGCGTNLYCPESPVTRAQMAVFLLKAKHGSAYIPPPVGAGTGFNDVPTSHWAAPWIKQLASEGITGGCGANLYCPESPVTRAQMAVFLVITFGLP